ncbi:hypothetical protein K5E40_27410 [Pseudomonas baetica]|uniref:hypothetical protein n=1 Tax=Pseudomonas baetica TaxID=674054 RepID=UPI001C8CB385|nr:hypothetical protein [Pseudomonas baetica]MBX9409389.1 hypothetical protein [Pseudomonas baetica]
MANRTEKKAVFIDGEFTITTKDVTEGASDNLTSFTTQALDYHSDLFRPGFHLICFKDKGLSSERRVVFTFGKANGDLTISDYSETVDVGTFQQELRPHQFEIIDSKLTVEKTQISPNKHKFVVTAFKFTAKADLGDEARVVSGKGSFLVNEMTLPI